MAQALSASALDAQHHAQHDHDAAVHLGKHLTLVDADCQQQHTQSCGHTPVRIAQLVQQAKAQAPWRVCGRLRGVALPSAQCLDQAVELACVGHEGANAFGQLLGRHRIFVQQIAEGDLIGCQAFYG